VTALAAMRPLAAMPVPALARIDTVLCDIDDTLTSGGRLPAESYAAIERLEGAGVTVIPVTGRPAGWCDHIARMWPVAAIVGENGAFYFRYERVRRRMLRRYARPAATRRADRRRLSALARAIVAAVPGSAVAADQAYREADLAIDFCEDVPRLPMGAVERIVAMFREAGARAKISSVHVNGWFGDYDKLTTVLRLLRECFEIGAEAARRRCAFVGDSPNDSPMFGYFGGSVGVANVRDFGDRIDPPPAYVTTARGGAGFAEFAVALLAARSA